MPAYDTSLTPVSVAPANDSETTLDPDNDADAFIYVDVTNIGTAAIAVRVGITPSGGSVQWKLYDFVIPIENSILSMGPWFIKAGDVVTVRTDTADDAVFSLTGAESSV